MRIPDNFDFTAIRRDRGHLHLWRRDMSRRQFLGATALATGAAVSSALWMPALAAGENAALPNPIPGGITVGGTLFHVFLPGAGAEPSSITDFNGTVGVAHVQGTGKDSGGNPFLYDTDLRFMDGVYIGKDGRTHKGTFGFV